MPRSIPLSGLLQQIKVDQGTGPRPGPSQAQLRTGSLRSSQSLGGGSGTDMDSEGSAPPGSALPAPASVSVSVDQLHPPSLQAQLASAGGPPAAPQPGLQPMSLGFQAPRCGAAWLWTACSRELCTASWPQCGGCPTERPLYAHASGHARPAEADHILGFTRKV